MTTWHIKKSGEDNYHVEGEDMIDEDVDGPKLMGMLASKGLTVEQINEILSSLDAQTIGSTTPIAFRNEPHGY
jgi:hypothetical protein